MDIQQVKQRFGIIGNAPALNRALEVATQVAPTDISVLVTGESGTGKENIPKVIHNLSKRKHAPYIAVNCGAIPEGTIDSELFGHEKGSFTGASAARKGYFEVADGGTIFLDEVAELPLQTQVRLLRVLETGEFIKVGSSKVIKTNVRVVAATNVKMTQAIKNGKFREDLFYRLNTVPVMLPPLRERKQDIYLLFRKFASDFADKFKMPQIQLTPQAIEVISAYDFPGNIRQLKNITEQISVIERERTITPEILLNYLPETPELLPAVIPEAKQNNSGGSESYTDRELLYKVLFDLKAEVHDLKLMLNQLNQAKQNFTNIPPQQPVYQQPTSTPPQIIHSVPPPHGYEDEYQEPEEVVEESLSLEDREKELIRKALQKHKGKRKSAAKELGISERTLYRKIKEFNLHQ